jgi:hypothetical protein
MREIKQCFILAGTAMLVACATQSPAPATTPVVATAASVPAASASATPTAKIKIPDGYVKVMVNGEVRYCRNDTDTGSRLAHTTVCLTEAQLQASQNGTQDMMNQMQNRNGIGATMTGAPQGMGH